MHGSFQTATSYDLMAEQKEDVEKLMSSPVVSSRQHNLHFKADLTPAILDRAGIQVDSTMGFNRDVGFRAGTSYPFNVWDLKNECWLNLVEVPLILHDCALLRPDNLDLHVESAFVRCKEMIDQVAAVRGVVTLLWHPESYVKPGWFDLYVRLLAYLKEENAWATSSREIARWWKSSGNQQRLQKLIV